MIFFIKKFLLFLRTKHDIHKSISNTVVAFIFYGGDRLEELYEKIPQGIDNENRL